MSATGGSELNPGESADRRPGEKLLCEEFRQIRDGQGWTTLVRRSGSGAGASGRPATVQRWLA